MNRLRQKRFEKIIGTASPLSPADLAKLDRKLTTAEQAAVDEWQSKTSDAELAAVEKTGAPKARTVAVTTKGAVIERPRSWIDGFLEKPWWQLALAAGGVLAVGVGGYMLLRGSPHRRGVRKFDRHRTGKMKAISSHELAEEYRKSWGHR